MTVAAQSPTNAPMLVTQSKARIANWLGEAKPKVNEHL